METTLKKKIWIIVIVYQLILFLIFLFYFGKNNRLSNVGLIKERLTSWDSLIYISIAENWYVTEGDYRWVISFFPFYSILIRGLNIVIKSSFWSGLLISNIASIIAHYFLFVIFDEEIKDNKLRNKSYLLFLLSPISVYFLAIYTESLYLLLSVLFFYYLRKRKYIICGILGGFSSLTRIMGILLLVPYYVNLLKDKLGRKKIRNYFFGLLVIIGYLIFLWINWKVYNDPLYYLQMFREFSHKSFVNPFIKYCAEFRELITNPRDNFVSFYYERWSVIISLIIMVLYLIIKFIRKEKVISWDLILWSFMQWIITAGQSFWMSSMRYVGILFPIYIS